MGKPGGKSTAIGDGYKAFGSGGNNGCDHSFVRFNGLKFLVFFFGNQL